MKYLKVWMDVVSGSHLGRDDGLPQQKQALIENLDELVRTYAPSASYFKLTPVDVREVVKVVQDFKGGTS